MELNECGHIRLHEVATRGDRHVRSVPNPAAAQAACQCIVCDDDVDGEPAVELISGHSARAFVCTDCLDHVPDGLDSSELDVEWAASISPESGCTCPACGDGLSDSDEAVRLGSQISMTAGGRAVLHPGCVEEVAQTVGEEAATAMLAARV